MFISMGHDRNDTFIATYTRIGDEAIISGNLCQEGLVGATLGCV